MTTTLRLGLDSDSMVQSTYQARFALRALGIEARTTEALMASLGQGMSRTAGILFGIGTASVAIGKVVTSAKEMQSALIDVSNTTGLMGANLDALRTKILALGASLPVPILNLAKFAEVAGKQIETPEGVEDFVRGMARLSAISPDLVANADEAARSVARFLQLAGESPTNIQPLADSIADLRDSFKTTASAILITAEQVIRGGSGFLRSSADVLGLSAAMNQLGVESNTAGAAVSQVFTAVRRAFSSGGVELSTLLQLTGSTKEQLREALDTSAAEVFIRVMRGVAQSGRAMQQSLEDIGLGSSRQTRQLAPLIQNFQQLTKGIDVSRDAQRLGTAAAKELEEITKSLAGQLGITKNLIDSVGASSEGLASALAGGVGVINAILGDITGVGDASQGASDEVRALATSIEAMTAAVIASFAISGLKVVVEGITKAIAANTAIVIANNAANQGRKVTRSFFGPESLAEVASRRGIQAGTGQVLGQTLKQAGAGLAAFAFSPIGATLAVGGLAAGLVALQRHLDNLRTDRARAEIADFRLGVEGLDGLVAGLAEARDVIFGVDLEGEEDVDGKLQALRQQLALLDRAKNAIFGEIRRGVEPLAVEARAAVNTSIKGLMQPEAEERAQAILTASVQALNIPSLPPEKAAELQRSINEAFDGIAPEAREHLQAAVALVVAGVTIPTVQLAALDVDELFPDVKAAGDLFQRRLVGVVSAALDAAKAEFQQASAEIQKTGGGSELRKKASVTGKDFFPKLEVSDFLPENLSEQIGEILGGDVGKKAQDVLIAAIENIALPGISPDKSKALTDSVRAALSLVSTGEVDTDGVKALEITFRAAGLAADDLHSRISAAATATAEEGFSTDAIRVLAIALQQAGVGAVSAENALRAFNEARDSTKADIENPSFVPPALRVSDFFRKESARIEEAIRDANLSIGRFYKDVGSQSLDPTIGSSPVQLRGFEARKAALEAERAAYEELLIARLNADKDALREEELPEARAEADALLAAKIGVEELNESQRALGVQQALLAGQSSVLGQELQNLGLQARGDTAQAFDILRKQIELVYSSTLKGLEVDFSAGTKTKGEVDAAKEQADAQRAQALTGVGLQESLVGTRRVSAQLGVEQIKLAGQTAVLDQELRGLSLRGLSESARGYEILREQIELAYQASLKGIQAKLLEPDADQGALRAEKEVADANRAAALDVLELQKAFDLSARSHNKLGVEQDLLSRKSGALGQALQILGIQGAGETTQAFDLMRQQIELTFEQAQLAIEQLKLSPDPEIQARIKDFEALAQAEHDLAVEAQDAQEELIASRRAISDIGIASSNASRGLVAGLLGSQKPLEALKQTLESIAASLLQPRIEAGILGLFGGRGRQAAEQQGIGDIFRSLFGDGNRGRGQAGDLSSRGIAGEGAGALSALIGSDLAPQFAAAGIAAESVVSPMGAVALATTAARNELVEFAIALKAATAAAQAAAGQQTARTATNIITTIGSGAGRREGGSGPNQGNQGITAGGGGGGGGRPIIQYNSNVTVNGGRSQLEAGQRISLRQFERDIRGGFRIRIS